MNLTDELFSIIQIFESEEIPYAICGGLAVAIHGYPRLTRDIDIMIRETDLERAQTALRTIDFILSSGVLPFDSGTESERKVFRVNKAEGNELLTLDLVLVTPFLQDVWSDREKHELENQEVVVVSKNGLAKMKRAAGRSQDFADLENLGLSQQ